MTSSKKGLYLSTLKNSSPDSKADFSEKSVLGILGIILSRYDLVIHIKHVIYVV